MSAVALEPTLPPPIITVLPGRSRVVAEMTPAEYHAFLRTANDKYEYVDGKVIQMPGASPEHNRIAKNLLVELDVAFERTGADCEVFGSDQKVFITPNRYYLADVVVVCGNGQFDFEDCLRNPLLIAEVLSSSTGVFDQGDKFRDYRRIESLRHYLVIRQDAPSVTHYEKGENGIWSIIADPADISESLPLTLNGVVIPLSLARLYRRIAFAVSEETSTLTESAPEVSARE